MKKLAIILEYKDGEFWAWTRSEGDFLLSTVGLSPDEVTNSLKDLLQDWIEHEGQEREEWKNVKVEDIQFEYQYCITGFFHAFSDIKITAIAKRTGISNSLMKQYAGGFAYLSEERVKIIEKAIRDLGRELSEVTLVHTQKANPD